MSNINSQNYWQKYLNLWTFRFNLPVPPREPEYIAAPPETIRTCYDFNFFEDRPISLTELLKELQDKHPDCKDFQIETYTFYDGYSDYSSSSPGLSIKGVLTDPQSYMDQENSSRKAKYEQTLSRFNYNQRNEITKIKSRNRTLDALSDKFVEDYDSSKLNQTLYNAPFRSFVIYLNATNIRSLNFHSPLLEVYFQEFVGPAIQKKLTN